ncbi:MAG: hypothetical protein JWO09_3044 [Bacteroidetes bacterium]|nr:hypothetical protein [Bacteroidota bacterium]
MYISDPNMSDLYNTYKGLPKEKLFHILLSPGDYQPDAIAAARQVLSDKSWTADFGQEIERRKQEEEQKHREQEEEVIEKAAYYKNVVEYKSHRNSFQIRIPDMPRFEIALTERNIEYFREDKHIGVQLDNYPTQTYYFKNEDAEQVDKLVKELQLITTPYADYKPFFKFELKAIAAAIVIIFLVLFIFSLF